MKKTVIILSAICGLYTANLKAQTAGCTTPVYQDPFTSSTGWNIVDPVSGNGSVQVTGGSLQFSNLETGTSIACNSNLGACNGREIRLFKALPGGALSNNTWRAECKFRITTGNGPAHTLMGFTAGNIEPQGHSTTCPTWTCGGTNTCTGAFGTTNIDGIFASIVAFGSNQVPNSQNDKTFKPTTQSWDVTHMGSTSNPTDLGWRIFGHAKNDAGAFYPANVIAASNTASPAVNYSRGIELPSLSTDYYLRLERLSSGSCVISVFSDVAMTQHLVGSPQCFSIDQGIQNLNTIQNFTHESGDFFRSLTGSVDDIKVYDQCSVAPALTASPTNNASICAGNGTTITATPGFTTYTWVGGTTNTTTTGNSIWVTPSATTVYTVSATYPGVNCPVITTTTVTVTSNPYVNFNPDFTLVGTSPAGNNTYFTASATPIGGSTNFDITNHGSGYGYLWKIEQVSTSGTSTVVANNPSNWWVNSYPYAPIYAPQNNNFCGFNGSSVNTSSGYACTGTFNLSMKYRVTRGVWNPCVYTEKAKLVYFCTNCRSANGEPVIIVEDDVEYNSKPHTREVSNEFISQTLENSVKIYPNPNNGSFAIETEFTEDQNVEVYDINGKMVLKQMINGNTTINANDLPDGIYNVKIMNNNKTINKRIIIAK